MRPSWGLGPQPRHLGLNRRPFALWDNTQQSHASQGEGGSSLDWVTQEDFSEVEVCNIKGQTRFSRRRRQQDPDCEAGMHLVGARNTVLVSGYGVGEKEAVGGWGEDRGGGGQVEEAPAGVQAVPLVGRTPSGGC